MPAAPIDTNQTNGKVEKQDAENAPVRQITQTDHLNKRLLVSFLNRINKAEIEVDDNQTTSNDDNEESDSKFE